MRLALTLATAITAASCQPAFAEAVPDLCMPIADLIKNAKELHDEVPFAVGTVGGGNRVIVLARRDGKSFGIFETDANSACYRGSGVNLHPATPETDPDLFPGTDG